MNVFDFVNSIHFNKKRELFDEPQADKSYVPFIVNRAMSFFPDTVMYGNEMNQRSELPKRWQYDYLMGVVPKQRRFSKWPKKPLKAEDIEAVCKAYKYSVRKAVQVIPLLTEEQIEALRLQQHEGGKP